MAAARSLFIASPACQTRGIAREQAAAYQERCAIVRSSVFESGFEVVQRLVRTVNRLHRFCTG
jgi:hypothetical protein